MSNLFIKTNSNDKEQSHAVSRQTMLEKSDYRNLEQGDIIKVDVTTSNQRGNREKRAYHPAVVISNNPAICITGFVKVVPVQSENFDDDLTVALTTTPDNPRVTGYAEPFQERSLDLLARPYNYFGKVTEDELLEILGKHNMLTDRL